MFHSSVYSDIFSFFPFSLSFTDEYILSVAGRRVQQNVSDEQRAGEVEEGNFPRGGDDV